MSTGNLSLDILLEKIKNTSASCDVPSIEMIAAIKKQFPSLNDAEALDIYNLICALQLSDTKEKAKLVLTAPPSFSVKALSTRNMVSKMLSDAKNSITITGYSLSEYFDDMMDLIIQKSRSGVFVKFFVNMIDQQPRFEKLYRYKGRFLKIYNYKNSDDHMSALHAKVLSVDKKLTLITSANLSYHGQQGNIELGALIESTTIARQVDDIFTQLLFSKVFSEI